MSEADDEYLWSGEGTASDEVAGFERSLGVLRWQPRGFLLPADAEVIPLRREEGAGERSSWWPTVVAGLVAAAAVFALLVWGGGSRTEIERQQPSPSVEPTAPPSSPDLKDPWGPSEPKGFTPPNTDPEPAPTSSSDLKDPFEDRSEPEPRPRKPKRPDGSSPDLKDPFGGWKREDRVPAGELVDPIGPPDDSRPRTPSSDLKDPFSKLDAEAEAGEDR
jgi:hypothetical protein